jgi:hypothetical protein
LVDGDQAGFGEVGDEDAGHTQRHRDQRADLGDRLDLAARARGAACRPGPPAPWWRSAPRWRAGSAAGSVRRSWRTGVPAAAGRPPAATTGSRATRAVPAGRRTSRRRTDCRTDRWSLGAGSSVLLELQRSVVPLRGGVVVRGCAVPASQGRPQWSRLPWSSARSAGVSTSPARSTRRAIS